MRKPVHVKKEGKGTSDPLAVAVASLEPVNPTPAARGKFLRDDTFKLRCYGQEQPKKGRFMFNDFPFDAATNCAALDSTASLKIGDRVLVLFGDTPILGTIDSAHGLVDAEGMAWNIRTDASGRTYPIHEGFLRRTSLAAN